MTELQVSDGALQDVSQELERAASVLVEDTVDPMAPHGRLRFPAAHNRSVATQDQDRRDLSGRATNMASNVRDALADFAACEDTNVSTITGRETLR